MITEEIGKRTIKRHDDIGELVVKKFNLFNEYGLYDVEIGGMESLPTHFQKMDQLLGSPKPEDLIQARHNLHQAFFHIFGKNNFPALEWCVLLDSVDGAKLEDLSVENLKRVLDDLSEHGLTQAKVRADVDAAKKKFGRN